MYWVMNEFVDYFFQSINSGILTPETQIGFRLINVSISQIQIYHSFMNHEGIGIILIRALNW